VVKENEVHISIEQIFQEVVTDKDDCQDGNEQVFIG
jgi:hypothetical protein